MPQRRSGAFEVDVDCRLCGERHRVSGVAEYARQPIVFGGGAVGAEGSLAWAGPVTCPREHRPFEAELLIPAADGESLRAVEIRSVGIGEERQEAPAAAHAEPAPPARDWIDEELAEWRKSSVETARTYATTMLATSTGGVPLYFAVLNYLGWEEAKFSSAFVALTLLPPILLFAAAAAFTLALRPALSYVDRSEYAQFRAGRIERMQARSTLGTALFAGALLVSIVVFFVVLREAS